MPRYVVVIDWTDEGRKNFAHTRQGYLAAQDALVATGARFADIYWTLGEHDLVGILEADDDEAAAAATLSISSLGGVRATATRAFGLDEIQTVLNRAGDAVRSLAAAESAEREKIDRVNERMEGR
jgi:uncharacterized protein with GYD domain